MDMFIFIIGLLTAPIAIIVLIVKLIRKQPLKKTGYTILAGFVLMIIGLSMATSSGENQPATASLSDVNEKDEEEETKDEDEVKPEEPEVVKEKLSFTLSETHHDIANNRIIVKGTTNIADGVRIGVMFKTDDIFDIPAAPGFAHIENGEFEVALEYYDYILNRTYKLSASMGSLDNEKFVEAFGSYENFMDHFEIEGDVKKTDIGLVVDAIPLGQIEITDGITQSELEQLMLESLKQDAKEISFAHLNKNPDRYAGEYVKYKGEIVQILEGNNMTNIRLAVTPTSYGYDYGDIVYVEYSGYTDFVDGDIVTVYGSVFGAYSYTSQAGWQITLPAIIADIIE